MGKAGDRARDCVPNVYLDPSHPSRISFVIWCSVQTGEVRFSVGRTDGSEIVAFSRNIEPSGAGAHGVFRCEQRGQTVKCAGRKGGPVTLRGWLAIPVETRCAVDAEARTAGIIFQSLPIGCPGSRPERAPDRFGYMRGFRKSFGLDPDLHGDQAAIDRRIRGLVRAWRHGNPVARVTNSELGLPLRAVDIEELEYRDAYLNQTATILERWVPHHAASTYAGYDFDHEHGGIFYIGFTGDQDAQLAAFKRRFDLIAPERIKPFPIPPTHSERELFALEGEILKWWFSHDDVINQMGLNTLANKVEVGTQNVKRARRLLAERFGANAPILVVFAAPIRPVGAAVGTGSGPAEYAAPGESSLSR